MRHNNLHFRPFELFQGIFLFNNTEILNYSFFIINIRYFFYPKENNFSAILKIYNSLESEIEKRCLVKILQKLKLFLQAFFILLLFFLILKIKKQRFCEKGIS